MPGAHTSPARPGEEFRHLLPSAVLFLLVHLPLAQATAVCLSPQCPYVTCERDTIIFHIRSLSRCLWLRLLPPQPPAAPNLLDASPSPYHLHTQSSCPSLQPPACFFTLSFLLLDGSLVPKLALVLLLLLRCSKYETDYGELKSPSAGLRERPGVTRVNSEVFSVQLLLLLTTLDPSHRKTSQEINPCCFGAQVEYLSPQGYLSQDERSEHNSSLMSHVQLAPDRI